MTQRLPSAHSSCTLPFPPFRSARTSRTTTRAGPRRWSGSRPAVSTIRTGPCHGVPCCSAVRQQACCRPLLCACSAAPAHLPAQPNAQPTSSHPYCPPSPPSLSTAFGRADYFDDLVASVNDMTRGNDWFLLGALRCCGRVGGQWKGCPGVLARCCLQHFQIAGLPSCCTCVAISRVSPSRPASPLLPGLQPTTLRATWTRRTRWTSCTRTRWVRPAAGLCPSAPL